MKNTMKCLGIIVLVAVIGFSFIACDALLNSLLEGSDGVPAIPRGLTATAVSSSDINLSWNSVSGATGYNVYNSTSSGGTYGLLGTTKNTTAVNNKLSANTTVYYKVTAYNSYGESGYSSIASATTLSDGTNPDPSGNTVPVISVSLNKTSIPLLTVGNSEILTATVVPSNATNKSVSWTSSNSSVASVLNGTVTALSAGTATITVTTADGNKQASCTVTVTGNEPTTPLTQDVWMDGTVSASDSTAWYSFTAVGGTTYYLWWNDKDQGYGSKTADVRVSAYEPNGTAIFTTVDRGWTSSRTILVNTTGTVKIKVVPYNAAGIGTFGVVYSTSSTRPSVVGSIDGRTFTSISAFNAALADTPANTKETAYNVNINIGNLGGVYNTSGSLGRALRDNNTKFVNINLTGSTITSIPNDSLRYCTSLAGITIGGSVVSIGTYAFSGCTGLTSATIGNSVTVIGKDAFSGCTSLAAVTMGSGVTSIGEAAFYGDTLLTDVTIGSGVTSIGNSAFRNCTSLAGITIPNSVTSIGDGAFRGCIGLTGITIPNNVTSIGSTAFYGCTILSSVTFTATSKVATIGNSAFSGCTILATITIPDSVTLIDIRAFENCTQLNNVTIGSRVATIGNYAFNGCTNLTRVTFLGTVGSIGSSALPGDLRAKHIAGGAGTYTGPSTWTK